MLYWNERVDRLNIGPNADKNCTSETWPRDHNQDERASLMYFYKINQLKLKYHFFLSFSLSLSLSLSPVFMSSSFSCSTLFHSFCFSIFKLRKQPTPNKFDVRLCVELARNYLLLLITCTWLSLCSICVWVCVSVFDYCKGWRKRKKIIK